MTEKHVAKKVAEILIDHGHETYFAGGCVRDRLLGKEPKDFDIATSATPEEVLTLFPNSDQVGKHFGVIIVKSEGFHFEIATFRCDGSYSDNRRPDSVTFTSAREDAQRRDFTINALFEHPLTGEIIDHVNGLLDINNKVLRCVGNPNDRFKEDALRILRLFRFKAKLDGVFSIEKETYIAAKSHAKRLKDISIERINSEMVGVLLAKPHDIKWFFLLYEWSGGNFHEAFNVDYGNVMFLDGRQGLNMVEALVVLGCWSADQLRDLKFTNNVVKDVVQLTELTKTLSDINTDVLDSDMALLRKTYGNKHIQSAFNVLGVTEYFEDHIERIKEFIYLFEFLGTELLPVPIITGEVLINLGFKPSPAFKEVIDWCYVFQLNNNVPPSMSDIHNNPEIFNRLTNAN